MAAKKWPIPTDSDRSQTRCVHHLAQQSWREPNKPTPNFSVAARSLEVSTFKLRGCYRKIRNEKPNNTFCPSWESNLEPHAQQSRLRPQDQQGSQL